MSTTDSTEQIRAALKQQKDRSKAQIDSLYANRAITFPELNERITEYILAKFMLKRQECEGIDFQKLSELSLSKTMKISPELVKEFDTARNCAGATSAIAKKTLLYLSLQKALKSNWQRRKLRKSILLNRFPPWCGTR